MSENSEPASEFYSTAGLYQTKMSVIIFAVTGAQRILTADARRMYVSIVNANGGSTCTLCLPGPVLDLGGLVTQVPHPLVWKWVDCPSVTTGEFYAYPNAMDRLAITEVLYLGG